MLITIGPQCCGKTTLLRKLNNSRADDAPALRDIAIDDDTEVGAVGKNQPCLSLLQIRAQASMIGLIRHRQQNSHMARRHVQSVSKGVQHVRQWWLMWAA